jgi:pyruvate kinase
MTPSVETARRLTLAWGVHPVLCPEVTDVAGMSERACEAALREGLAAPGDTIVISAGVPFGTPGTTNLLRIAQVG